MKHSLRVRLSALLLTAVFCLPAGAEQGGQSVRADGYEIHYAAINTMDIPPETARTLDIRRSGARALLVINAQKGPEAESVRAEARGEIRNLAGQSKPFSPRAVQDGGVWYLLASFRISDFERLRFELEVTPESADRAIPLRFEQTFYREH